MTTRVIIIRLMPCREHGVGKGPWELPVYIAESKPVRVLKLMSSHLADCKTSHGKEDEWLASSTLGCCQRTFSFEDSAHSRPADIRGQHTSMDKPHTDGDTVIPCHFYNGKRWAQTEVENITLRFDAVLDPQKLEAALLRLMEMGNWRKLGARIRQSTTGGLEYHIPSQFTHLRPAFAFSHHEESCSITEHPFASTLPKCHGRLQTFHDFVQFESLVHPGAPRTIEEWTRTDSPALFLHVVVFADATLLSIQYCHIFLDIMALQQLYTSWIAVLEGRGNDVPELVGFDKDPFDDVPVSAACARRWIMADKALGGLGIWLFRLRPMLQKWFEPEPVRRTVCIPGKFIQALHEDARKEMPRFEKGAFVSEGDVFYAWWARTIVKANRLYLPRPVSLGTIVNIRPFLDAFAGSGIYIGRAITGVTALSSTYQVLHASIAATALLIRRAVQQQATTEQIHARLSRERMGLNTIVGRWNQLPIVFSNWQKCGLFDLDFGEAIRETGESASASLQNKATCTPSFIGYHHYKNGSIALPNSFSAVGKDRTGDWWMMGRMMPKAWAFIDDLFSQINGPCGT